MAIASLNPAFEGFSGTLGDLVFKRYWNKTVVTSRPCFKNRVLSPAQQANLERFKQAGAYARQIKADPVLLAQYREKAKAQGMTLRNFVFKEYFAACKTPAPNVQNSAISETESLIPQTNVVQEHGSPNRSNTGRFVAGNYAPVKRSIASCAHIRPTAQTAVILLSSLVRALPP